MEEVRKLTKLERTGEYNDLATRDLKREALAIEECYGYEDALFFIKHYNDIVDEYGTTLLSSYEYYEDIYSPYDWGKTISCSLIEKIESSNLEDEVKDFLIHTINYEKLGERDEIEYIFSGKHTEFGFIGRNNTDNVYHEK